MTNPQQNFPSPANSDYGVEQLTKKLFNGFDLIVDEEHALVGELRREWW